MAPLFKGIQIWMLTPVERIDGSPQLGLPSESLIKAEAFGTPIFFAVLGVQNPVFVPVFLGLSWSFVLTICVSPRSLRGGGFPGRIPSIIRIILLP